MGSTGLPLVLIKDQCINSLCQCRCLLLCLCHFSIQFPQISPNPMRLHRNLDEVSRILPQHWNTSVPFKSHDTQTSKFCCSTCFLAKAHSSFLMWSSYDDHVGNEMVGNLKKSSPTVKSCHSACFFTELHIEKWRRHSLRQRHWHS